MEKSIQFVANYDDWVSVKKLKIEEKTNPKTVMEFLASLGTGIDNKIAFNLGKVVDLKRLDSAIKEVKLGKTEEETAIALKELNSRKVSQAVKEITELPELQANERKELEQFCRVYATRKILSECGLIVDYSRIEIPGMKRLQKKN